MLKQQMGSVHSHGKMDEPRRTSFSTDNEYFGDDQMEEMTTDQLQAKIRDLTLEKLYKRAPRLRPKEPDAQIKLKSMLSLNQFQTETRGNVTCIAFSLKSDAPALYECKSNNLCNSVILENFEQATGFAIPIPAPGSDFTLEVTPDLKSARTPVKEGYTAVIKHVFVFKFTRVENVPCYECAEQRLFIGADKPLIIDMHKICATQSLPTSTKCVLCGSQEIGDSSQTQCGHRFTCTFCTEQRELNMCKCPECGVLYS